MIQLESKEVIIYTARKHWFIFLIEIIFVLAAAVVPALIIYFVLETGITNLIIFLYLIWLLILWIVMTLIWTDYYLDVWYITNQRIIDVEQRGLFNRKISTFRLDMIQDTTIEVPGILATLIGYGDIHIQTAGQDEKFTLRGVNNPARVNQIITAEYSRARDALREVRIAG